MSPAVPGGDEIEKLRKIARFAARSLFRASFSSILYETAGMLWFTPTAACPLHLNPHDLFNSRNHHRKQSTP
ncbi:MAG: hypothetical protein N2C14_24760 [Planctomycetales bacterium]